MKMKKLNGKNQGPPATSARPTRPSALPRWLLPVLLVAAAGVGTYFVLSAILAPKLPDELVGTWQVQMPGTKANGDKMTYQRDGTFTALVKLDDGREAKVQARVEVHDKTLRYMFVDPAGGRKETRTQAIKSLTPTEMIVEENGRRLQAGAFGMNV